MIFTEIDQRSLRELEELRRRHHAAARALRTTGNTAVTRVLAYVTTELGEVWENTAPRLTGTLASATRERIFQDQGKVFIDPTVENPVFGGMPVRYGPAVHGRKPWVDQLWANDMPRIMAEGGERLFREMDGIYQ